MRRLFAWRDRHARALLPLLALFTVLCAAGMTRLRFDGDFARLNGVRAEARRDEDIVRETWGKALSLTTVVATGANREEALQKNERVFAVLRALRDKGVIQSYSSIAPLFPSEQAARSNLRDWSAFWSEPRRRELSDRLVEDAIRLGYKTNAFGPFLEHIAAEASLPTGDAPALDRLLGDYWNEQDGGVSVCSLVKTGGGASFAALRQALDTEAPGALLLDKVALSDEIVKVARRALPVFAALVVALNAVLLHLLLGRAILVLITLLPMAVGLFWTLGTLGLLGQPIDMANFIFAIFIIGVGGDYSLFMVMAELEPLRGRADHTASTGGAVTICAGTTLLGVGALVLAKHPAMFSLGLSAWLGISLTLLATLFLVPPCMALLRRRAAATASALSGETQPGLPSARRRRVCRLYRYQGPGVSGYVYWKLRADPLFQALDEAVPARGHILDIGCGRGLVANWLALGFPHRALHGIDHDAAKIRVARAVAGPSCRLSFEECDLLSKTWPSAGVVLLCDVLHYFPRELKAELLRRAFACLPAGGRLIIRDAMAKENSGNRAVAGFEKWAVRLGQNKTRHGLHFEDQETHLGLLREAGFTRVEIKSGSGLGSNALLVAVKDPDPQPADQRSGARGGSQGV
jgi:SAM-dependent methyltransferase